MQRARHIGASVLAVLTAVLLLLASLGIWANRYFLNSQRFTTTANQILDERTVQDALAIVITNQISNAAGTDLQIVEPFITNIVTGVVQSDQFQTLFDAAVLRLHESVVGGGARQAVLNLSDVVDRVHDAIAPIAPDLADKIPSGEKLQITILDQTQLDTVYNTVNLVNKIVWLLSILTVVCFAGAIALSPRRWRTLALTGWVTLGLFVARLIAQRVGRGLIGGFPKRKEFGAAAQSAFKVITHGLVVSGVVIAVIALLVALGAGWTDRHGGWSAITSAVRRGIRWIRDQLPERAPAPTPALATVGAAADSEPSAEAGTGPAGASSTRAVVEGLLAPRLPEPPTRARTAHWWRAVGLLAIGAFAVWSPGSLTSLIVVLLGVAALYLAVTEAVAAWGTPKDAADTDAVASPPDAATEAGGTTEA